MSIYLQAADGSGVAERLTTADDATEHRPESWSQAQRTLSYAVIQSDRSSGLWTMSLDAGSAPGLFYDDGVSAQRNSVFSPDGNWLAYTSTESGLFEVWVQPFPAVSGVKHRITQTGRSMAMWSPDGDELFYRPSPVGEATLLSIGLPNGPGSTFTGEQTLPVGEFVIAGDSRDYDITPDGERFLMVLRAQAESGTLYEPRIDFVLNWFEELEERVPVP